MNVLGLDVSLRHTGIAGVEGNPMVVDTGKLAKYDAIEMLIGVLEVLEDVGGRPDLAVLEGFAYASANTAHVLGEVGGVVRYWLYKRDIRWLELPPKVIKKYATGNGNANKYEVMQAAEKRLGYVGSDDNESDALWCRAAGLQIVGTPAVVLPKSHTDVLKPYRVET